MTKKPNFLYFITDQHRADWLGCAGHPVVKTPNIDALAAKGTRISDFHVAAPICQPNRASLLTGRMPSLHGMKHNGCCLPETATTFVDVLRADGYNTASIGKSHLQNFTGLAPLHSPDPEGEAPRLIEEAWADHDRQGDYDKESAARYAGDKPYDFPTPYYGFDHVDMLTSHGDRAGGHYAQWFRQQPGASDMWDDANQLPHNYSCPQAYRTPVPEELYPTTWVADRAIDYIQDKAGAEDPFFAWVSFPDPHHPFNPPGKYWDMYSPDQFDADLPYEAHKNPPPPLQWLEAQLHSGGKAVTPQTAQRVSDQAIREAKALTAGMITMIDDQIGRVIEALKASGEYDNTVIIFNTDHGDYLGDFGLILKGVLPTGGITHVPMIWSDPDDRTGQVAETMASTIDISATILERAGLTPYRGIQGKSFLPTIQDGRAHRTDLMIEFNDGAAKYGFEDPARVRTLRSKDWRFSIYGGLEWGELYDLIADPQETYNLWDSPDHQGVKGELSLRLAQYLTAQLDESPRATKIA